MAEKKAKRKPKRPAGPAPGQETEQGAGKDTLGTLALKAGERLLPVLITAGSLLGFVAFAGGVVLWTRFNAVDIPAEQAVDVVPDGELIAIGSVMLLLFGFFGALALIAAFIVDRSARPTLGMARALLVLFAIEGLVAMAGVDGRSAAARVGDVMLFGLPLVLAAWTMSVGRYSRCVDDLEPREREVFLPRWRYGALRRKKKWEERAGWERALIKAPVVVVLLGSLVAALLSALDAADTVLLSFLAFYAFLLAAWLAGLAVWDSRAAGDPAKPRRAPGSEDIELRMRRHRPLRLELTGRGELLQYLLLVDAVALVSLRVSDWWLAVSLAAAALIVAAVWRIATFATESLVWFGVALFLAVPLFGTVMTMARNLDEPKVQPMALIRSTDGPGEALQGLYVAETSDRIYFANIASEGCDEEARPDSGRLLWVPKDEVVAMSIGRAQGIEKAGRTAVEMAQALTPDVETLSGERLSLKVAEAKAETATDGLDHRLGDAGPAVRPEFGRGLSLKPAVAKPRQRVELRMTVPEAEGFGTRREGLTLRLNGVELRILHDEWSENTIAFRVPKNASSGVVTIGCRQLTGQPFLRVSRKPQARISVKLQTGSNRVNFDSRRSSDDGEIESREWKVSGLIRGEGKARISRALPPRTGVYRIKLTVTDDEGETDTEVVHLLRLRVPYFAFGEDTPESRRVVNEVRRAVTLAASEEDPPTKIEIDGHADDVGTPRYNAKLSWRRAISLESALRETPLETIWDEADPPRPRLTVRSFGETCPLEASGGRLRANRRVEVFILGRGARLIVPHSCHAFQIKRADW